MLLGQITASLTPGVAMSFAYKWHTILAGALRNDSAGKFIPVAYVTWNLTTTECGSHLLILPERFFTFDDASEFASSEARFWVDRHIDDLNRLYPGTF